MYVCMHGFYYVDDRILVRGKFQSVREEKIAFRLIFLPLEDLSPTFSVNFVMLILWDMIW